MFENPVDDLNIENNMNVYYKIYHDFPEFLRDWEGFLGVFPGEIPFFSGCDLFQLLQHFCKRVLFIVF